MSRLEMGGIEKTLLSCIPFFTKKGVSITILCNKGGSLDKSFEDLAQIIDFIAELVYHTVSGCMTAQVATEINYQVLNGNLPGSNALAYAATESYDENGLSKGNGNVNGDYAYSNNGGNVPVAHAQPYPHNKNNY